MQHELSEPAPGHHMQHLERPFVAERILAQLELPQSLVDAERLGENEAEARAKAVRRQIELLQYLVLLEHSGEEAPAGVPDPVRSEAESLEPTARANRLCENLRSARPAAVPAHIEMLERHVRLEHLRERQKPALAHAARLEIELAQARVEVQGLRELNHPRIANPPVLSERELLEAALPFELGGGPAVEELGEPREASEVVEREVELPQLREGAHRGTEHVAARVVDRVVREHQARDVLVSDEARGYGAKLAGVGGERVRKVCLRRPRSDASLHVLNLDR
mmetsp:Transcript_21826/g.70475  ORF Transcript_21826/g.70475 Transcript_21826/m.70475 type:complete len:281 (+) Transcript_21826:2559-3401(+)